MAINILTALIMIMAMLMPGIVAAKIHQLYRVNIRNRRRGQHATERRGRHAA